MANAKWGFGMAPLKPKTKELNRQAVINVFALVKGKNNLAVAEMVESISIFKGLLNRILRQDQWDWFTINRYFHYPRHRILHAVIDLLPQLRKSLIADDVEKTEECINILLGHYISELCEEYLYYDSSGYHVRDNLDYVYIASARETKSNLNIGIIKNADIMTNEADIAMNNSSVPSIRCIYKCRDEILAKSLIDQALIEYYIDTTEDEFIMKYELATKIIFDVLAENNLLV